MKGLLNKANTRKPGGEVLDSREYEHIVKKHIDTVYRIAISYTKTPADADDVVQQTFLKLLTKCPEFKDREHEKRWLIRVCVNECNSLFSSFWRRNVDSIDELSKEPEFTMEESNDLYYAIKELPAKCRIVIYLFYSKVTPQRRLLRLYTLTKQLYELGLLVEENYLEHC